MDTLNIYKRNEKLSKINSKSKSNVSCFEASKIEESFGKQSSVKSTSDRKKVNEM